MSFKPSKEERSCAVICPAGTSSTDDGAFADALRIDEPVAAAAVIDSSTELGALLRKLRRAKAGEATLEHPILGSTCARDMFALAVSVGTSGCKMAGTPGEVVSGLVLEAAAAAAAVRAATVGDAVPAGTGRFTSTGDIGCRTSIGEVSCRGIAGFKMLGLKLRGKAGDAGNVATRETSRRCLASHGGIFTDTFCKDRPSNSLTGSGEDTPWAPPCCCASNLPTRRHSSSSFVVVWSKTAENKVSL
mmetsp:Transcript_17928/g.35008  ORF Transcript_17928/g.35008 Transcript_17928/m.35008 type:complete len:246 (+) Transcript_17928:170-907(+)